MLTYYKIKDHLGNTRVVLDENGSVLQANNYYPFGMHRPIQGEGTQKYLYNGKELQEGIEWLDYGFRMYDPQIGRWHVADPMMERGGNLSPYSYAFNNPVSYIDPFGLWPDWWPDWLTPGDPREGRNTGDGSGNWKEGKCRTKREKGGYGDWFSNSFGEYDPWWELSDDLSYSAFSDGQIAGMEETASRLFAIKEANISKLNRNQDYYNSSVEWLREGNSRNQDFTVANGFDGDLPFAEFGFGSSENKKYVRTYLLGEKSLGDALGNNSPLTDNEKMNYYLKYLIRKNNEAADAVLPWVLGMPSFIIGVYTAPIGAYQGLEYLAAGSLTEKEILIMAFKAMGWAYGTGKTIYEFTGNDSEINFYIDFGISIVGGYDPLKGLSIPGSGLFK